MIFFPQIRVSVLNLADFCTLALAQVSKLILERHYQYEKGFEALMVIVIDGDSRRLKILDYWKQV